MQSYKFSSFNSCSQVMFLFPPLFPKKVAHKHEYSKHFGKAIYNNKIKTTKGRFNYSRKWLQQTLKVLSLRISILTNPVFLCFNSLTSPVPRSFHSGGLSALSYLNNLARLQNKRKYKSTLKFKFLLKISKCHSKWILVTTILPSLREVRARFNQRATSICNSAHAAGPRLFS